MTCYIIDTETTGLDKPQVIELGWLLKAELNSHKSQDVFVQRFRPSKDIELGALATHHIRAHELQDCPDYDTARLPDDAEYIVGHNVDFDWKVLGQPNVKRICTQAFARSLYPGLGSYKLGALAYYFWPDLAGTWAKTAHGVHTDILVCEQLLDQILTTLQSKQVEVDSFETLWKLCEHARIPEVMTFGKHKGMPVADVPKGYVDWYLKQADPDPYLVKAFADAQRARRRW
jgi:exodeoxyribonuclease X